MNQIILTRGQVFNHPVFLTQKTVGIAGSTPSGAGNGAVITTTVPHCLKVGDKVVAIHQVEGCGDPLPLTSTVVDVPSEISVRLDSNYATTAAGTANGVIGKALDMTGLHLCARLSTRAFIDPTPVINATFSGLAAQPNFVIVSGSTDFLPGDILTVPSAGILNQRIKAVWGNSDGDASCPPCDNAEATEDTNQELLLEFASPVVTADFYQVAGTRQGADLLDFDVRFPLRDDGTGREDRNCGLGYLYLSGRQTSAIDYPGTPSGCCSNPLQIGCLQLVLKQGYEVPDNYPPGDYVSEAVILANYAVSVLPGMSII